MTEAATIRAEELLHLHQMVDHLTLEEIPQAMDLLEDIFYSRPKVRARLEGVAQGPMIPMDEILKEYGLTMQDLEAHPEANHPSKVAA